MAAVAAVGGPCFGGGAGSRDDSSSSSSSGRLLKYRAERRCTTPKYAPPPPHSHSLSPGRDDGDSDWRGVGNTHTRCFPGRCCCFLLRMNATVLCVRWGDRTHRRTGTETADGCRCAVCCAAGVGVGRVPACLETVDGGGCCRTAWEARKGPGCVLLLFGGGGGLVHTVRSFIRCRALTAAAAGYFCSTGPFSLVQFGLSTLTLARCNSSHESTTERSREGGKRGNRMNEPSARFGYQHTKVQKDAVFV